jgi:exonuclease III
VAAPPTAMIVISWNCRGLGNPQTVRDLRRMVKVKFPTVVFLMETKMRQEKMERIRCMLGFNNLFVVDSVGKSGGLALFWKEEAGLEIQNYSRRHIHAIIKNGGGGQPWKFTAFYDHPEASRREEAWNLLKHLKNFQPHPWMCVGDFNEILMSSEKVGGSRRASGQMEAFKETLMDCELSYFGANGPFYTWNNGREGEDLIQERLDRVVASPDWREMFQGTKVVVEVTLNSDHVPLIVAVTENQLMKRRNYQNIKYEAHWGKNKESKGIIKQVWRRRFS